MKILVSEAVEVIYHCHDWTKTDWCEGKFGKSMSFHDGCVVIRSHKFEDTFKVFKTPDEAYIVFVDGQGYKGKTVKEAVDCAFENFPNSAYFEFKIGE